MRRSSSAMRASWRSISAPCASTSPISASRSSASSAAGDRLATGSFPELRSSAAPTPNGLSQFARYVVDNRAGRATRLALLFGERVAEAATGFAVDLPKARPPDTDEAAVLDTEVDERAITRK